jgi:hypothetical protein
MPKTMEARGVAARQSRTGYELFFAGRKVGAIARMEGLGVWLLSLEGRTWTELPDCAVHGLLAMGPGCPSTVLPFRDARAARDYAADDLSRTRDVSSGSGLPLFDAAPRR